MNRLLIIVIMCMPLWINAQTDNGIHWSNGLSWYEVKEKAKQENKYIFMDCFTTWCGPCKSMDKEVYSDTAVGKFFNEHFISVKVQMDKTDYDDDNVKKWYFDAKQISGNYAIVVFPSFLFFDPAGNPVHKATSYHKPEEFINIAKDAFDPKKQYYAIVKNFQPGTMDTSEMKGLARAFAGAGTDLAEKIAIDYLNRIPEKELGIADNLLFMAEFQKNSSVLEIAIKYLKELPKTDFINKKSLEFINYLQKQVEVQELVALRLSLANNNELRDSGSLQLMKLFNKNEKVNKVAVKFIDHLTHKELYSKKFLEFITAFVRSQTDKYFNLFFREGSKIDKIVGQKGYATAVIDQVVISNEVNPIIKATPEGMMPDFDSMYRQIKMKYGAIYADKNVLKGKVAFFNYYAKKYNKQWNEYFRYNIELIDKYGTDTTNQFTDNTILNNSAWDIFNHSTDINQINAAIKWMEGVVRRNPSNSNLMDTYANLLYKAGKSDEAMQWLKRALAIAKNEKQYTGEIEAHLSKMVKGEETWGEEN